MSWCPGSNKNTENKFQSILFRAFCCSANKTLWAAHIVKNITNDITVPQTEMDMVRLKITHGNQKNRKKKQKRKALSWWPTVDVTRQAQPG